MGEDVGPGPDQFESPLHRMHASIQKVVSAFGGGVPEAQRQENITAALRTTIQLARDAIQSPVSDAVPTVDEAIDLLNRENHLFVTSFRSYLETVADQIRIEERDKEDGV
jgi:hypothetical protein